MLVDAAANVPLRHFGFSGEVGFAGVTTRVGGVSTGPYESLNLGFHVGDDPDAVLENRRRLCASLGISLDSLTVTRQVHAGNVEVVDEGLRGRGARGDLDALGDTDALVTADRGIAIAVMLADCVPVVIYDHHKRVVAVAHAGWRGTVAHVTTNTLRVMSERFGSRPEHLSAGIGPSIGPSSYEVGPEVADAATDAFPNVEVLRRGGGQRWTFDLWAANRHELTAFGVPVGQIEVAGIDTRSSTDQFFSDRAVRPCGRFMAVGLLR